jgi:hypothetical protein
LPHKHATDPFGNQYGPLSHVDNDQNFQNLNEQDFAMQYMDDQESTHKDALSPVCSIRGISRASAAKRFGSNTELDPFALLASYRGTPLDQSALRQSAETGRQTVNNVRQDNGPGPGPLVL